MISLNGSGRVPISIPCSASGHEAPRGLSRVNRRAALMSSDFMLPDSPPPDLPGNLLGGETSPYLLQHKDNPVHWRPWGEAALAAARAQDKPILLSIGYAACHWCHVMAHESFEDEATASVMNRLFVCIKVDREERPDIDTIYMSALQHLGEQGGWPLTMFLTPRGEPFWGGTYFPKESSFGRPAFIHVLEEVARLYREEPGKIEQNRQALARALAAQAAGARPGEPLPEILDLIAERLLTLMDPVNGGIRGAPKFPQIPLLAFLWRAHLRMPDPASSARYAGAVTRALDHMCEGGIYDHLGGGFARYSVDERWLVPHFEKMLYDNAMLVSLLAEVWTGTRKPLYARRIRETVEWVLREMVAPAEQGAQSRSEAHAKAGQGAQPPENPAAFAASLDADSEGEEGRFYVWSEAGIDAVLGADSTFFKSAYDVRPGGNWEGRTILNRLARADRPFSEAGEERLAPMRARLLAARAGRIRPGFDDKILSDWNGLMIAALARAGAIFGEPAWIGAAVRAFRFVKERMIADGRLHHVWRANRLQHRAVADGLANMADAALALAEATAEPAYIGDAEGFAAELDAHYRDAAHGGYFFTADDAGDLIIRTRTAADSATPAANGVMPGVLTRLALLTGKNEYLSRADELIRAFAGETGHNFFPLGTWASGFAARLRTIQIVLIGPREARAPLRRAVLETALPARVLFEVEEEAGLPEGHPARGKRTTDGRAAAYVCAGETCSLPLTEPAELVSALLRVRAP